MYFKYDMARRAIRKICPRKFAQILWIPRLKCRDKPPYLNEYLPGVKNLQRKHPLYLRICKTGIDSRRGTTIASSMVSTWTTSGTNLPHLINCKRTNLLICRNVFQYNSLWNISCLNRLRCQSIFSTNILNTTVHSAQREQERHYTLKQTHNSHAPPYSNK